VWLAARRRRVTWQEAILWSDQSLRDGEGERHSNKIMAAAATAQRAVISSVRTPARRGVGGAWRRRARADSSARRLDPRRSRDAGADTTRRRRNPSACDDVDPSRGDAHARSRCRTTMAGTLEDRRQQIRAGVERGDFRTVRRILDAMSPRGRQLMFDTGWADNKRPLLATNVLC